MYANNIKSAYKNEATMSTGGSQTTLSTNYEVSNTEGTNNAPSRAGFDQNDKEMHEKQIPKGLIPLPKSSGTSRERN